MKAEREGIRVKVKTPMDITLNEWTDSDQVILFEGYFNNGSSPVIKNYKITCDPGMEMRDLREEKQYGNQYDGPENVVNGFIANIRGTKVGNLYYKADLTFVDGSKYYLSSWVSVSE